MKERKPRGRAPTSPPASLPWSLSVAVTDVPETGKHVELSPDDGVREAIARAAGVAALPRLEAVYDLTRHGRDGLRVLGRVSAAVMQNCVVTLEPMQTEIDEPVDLVFTPPRAESAGAPKEGVHTLDAEEPPETLRDGAVDLGALATEFLILAIDPYPRKPDAVFDAPPAGDPKDNPFAALAALKKDSSEDSGQKA